MGARAGRSVTRAILPSASAAVAALVVTAAACGSVEEAPPAARDGATFETAPPVHGITPCGKCVADACARERRGCAAEASCTKYLSCADACPSRSGGNLDPACEAACPRPADPAGLEAHDTFSACRTRGAGKACPACDAGGVRYSSPLLNQVCGPPPSILPAPFLCDAAEDPASLVPCTRCSFERCCDSRRRCDDSASCTAIFACTLVCPEADVKLLDQCIAPNDDGVEAYAQRIACVSMRCSAECDYPPCTRCKAEHCADLQVALLGTHDGFLFRQCELKCAFARQIDACVEACLVRYPSVRQANAEMELCEIRYCIEPCRVAP